MAAPINVKDFYRGEMTRDGREDYTEAFRRAFRVAREVEVSKGTYVLTTPKGMRFTGSVRVVGE